MIIPILFAASITLTPFDSYIGELDAAIIDGVERNQAIVCEFKYGPGTRFMPITRLTVNPYTQSYSDHEDAFINRGEGMQCGSTCAVLSFVMDHTGESKMTCELIK